MQYDDTARFPRPSGQAAAHVSTLRPRRARLLAVALAFVLVPVAAGAQSIPPPPPPPPPPSASPAPGITPSPGPASTPLPSGVPSPEPSGAVPSPSPSGAPPAPIRVDRSRVAVAPGARVVVHVSGGSGQLTVSPSFSGVDANFDPLARTLTLTGVANGRGTVTIADAFGDSAVINVLVAAPAGVVPTDVTLELAGTVSAAFVNARVADAVAHAAQLQPGATVTVNPVRLVPIPGAVASAGGPAVLLPGNTTTLTAAVTLRGNDQWADVSGTTTAHVLVSSLSQLDPNVLFYSDDPERLGTFDDGVLFRGTIDVTRPARVYAYHVSDVQARKLYLALAPTTGVAHVQVLGAAAGPSDAFPYVGHVSTLRYLLEHASQESFVTTVAPGAPYLLALGAEPMLPAQLIAAIYDVRVIDGAPVDVSVVAASNGADPTTFLGQPEHPSDGHYRRGEFSLSNVPPIALTYAAGGPEPQPFAVGVRYFANGQAAFPNLRQDITAQAGQRAPLAGDYGVLRPVSLQISNPTAQAQNVYLYEQPGANGGVTTTMWFAGDPAPTEVKCVSDPSQRYLVKGWGLAPGQTLTVTGTYMTDGTSFYPLMFGLTSTQPPPAPPNGCGAKPPAA
ncbi:MAG TPA: hypothetical protein VHT53_01250 [Candidatus Elarobacter sp.]|nr:hypothetical protein [Candidatus Elarobacter sp.]